MENMLDTTYNAYRRSYFKPEARAETYIPQYEIEFVKYLKQITENLERISNFNATVSSYLINDSSKKCFTLSTYFTMRIDIGLRKTK